MSVWSELARLQAGVVARDQLLGLGLTSRQVLRLPAGHHWQRIDRGIYLTHSGPRTDEALIWAATLRAGAGAVAGPDVSLWLAGARDELPRVLDVCVPFERHPQVAGIRITRRRGLAALTHPVLRPARLRLEDAVLDHCAAARDPASVIDIVLRVTQRRLTTAARINDRLAVRHAHPWRALLVGVLGEVREGIQSPLERCYYQDVERAHGLPAGRRNIAEGAGPSRRYRDVRYIEFGCVVELDGVEAHPDDERFRDRARDNRLAVSAEVGLRYGWREIATGPCAVAVEVGSLLGRGGWTGTVRPCGPGCLVNRAA